MSNDEQKITQNVIWQQINLCDYLSEQTNDYNLTGMSEAMQLQNINTKPNIQKEVRKTKQKKPTKQQNRIENTETKDKALERVCLIRMRLQPLESAVENRVFRILQFLMSVCSVGM